jgi:hypothetical protein
MIDRAHKASLNIDGSCSFTEFMKSHSDTWALKPQLYWIKNAKGQVAMDFIGKFENLEPDFATICDAIGITDKTLPRLVMSAKKANEDHFDSEVIDLVYKKYKEEIKLFGYEFEG